MILLGKSEVKNPVKLLERKNYILGLLGEGRPSASLSSQEYVSPEYWDGHTEILRKEVREIDSVLRKIKRK